MQSFSQRPYAGGGAHAPHKRRANDPAVDLVLVRPERGDTPRVPAGALRFTLSHVVGPGTLVERDDVADNPDAAMLIDLGHPDELLLVGGAIGRVPRGGADGELLVRATAGAEAWGRERAQERRRAGITEKLIQFSCALNAASTLHEVHTALLAHAVAIVGAHTAFLGIAAGDGTMRVVPGPRFPAGLDGLEARWRAEYARSGVTSAMDARPGTGAPLSDLASVFVQSGAALVARFPAWTRAVLFLVERRGGRVFDAGDWELLHALVQQAEVAVERVRLFEEVRALSLTDPLTGLGNRRQMELVLKHELAAAQRGGRLSLVMIDIDRFKEINDRDGHPVGDRVLQRVADTLREHLRGSDVAVRYGGDEFLLILPDAAAPGADALVQRIRAHLPPGVELSAGVAEYHTLMRSADDLIAAADSELYRDKRRRGERAPQRGGGAAPDAPVRSS